MKRDYDFCGWATKNNIECSDGRTICQNAFADNDGKKVPLVWQHQHNSADNVLGHAILENRREGVYAYCKLNDTYMGKNAKELVRHGDITTLSIFANQLKQQGGRVIHGNIRELSLVLAGANPEALIEEIALEHSDEGELIEAIIFSEEPIKLMHSDEDEDYEDDDEVVEESEDEEEDEEDYEEEDEEDMEHSGMSVEEVIDSMTDEQRDLMLLMVDEALNGESLGHSEDFDDYLEHADRSIGDVIDSMNEEQKKVMYYLIDQALNESSAAHSDIEEDYEMKYNVFEGQNEVDEEVLSHDALNEIIADARDNRGSLKQSFLAHAEDYGIDHIDYLFPDYKAVSDKPDFISRDMDWVQKVMSGVKHYPFSRIKCIHADITEDEARAKGYIKGDMKLEEVFGLLKRAVDPQTVYKKQKMDRDDIVDITSFDVVAWLKTEMRMMLNEELARAFLIGDGRSTISREKIQAEHIKPIWQDNSLYTINKVVTNASTATDDEKAKAFIKTAIKARKEYKGSGNPTLFTTEDMLTNMLLMEDTIGHRLYKTQTELATALMVKDIVTVPVMENQTRTASGTTYTLDGIIVNLNDYGVGADKGGSINMFEDFDIDYNQEKYLIETRCSSMLTKPYSAITIESTVAVG